MTKESPLERSLQVLEQIAMSNLSGLGLSEIARRTELPVPTVYRIVQGLMKAGLLMPGEGNKNYVLGRRLFRLFLASTDDGWLKLAAQPILDRLADKVCETTYLAQLVGQKIISISWAVPESGLRSKVYPGDVMPPHAAASAKAILAYQPDSVVRRTLAGSLEQYTPHTKIEFAQLQKEHLRIRKSGFATCWNEMELGLGAIACPIEVESIGVQYAIAVTGLAARLKDRPQTEILDALKQTAQQLKRVIEAGVRETLGTDAASLSLKQPAAARHTALAPQRSTNARIS